MKKRLVVLLCMVVVFAVSAVPAFAESTGSSGITSAMTTAFSTIASDAMSLISSVIPVALPILGAIVLVTIGIRMFRKITGR